MATAQFIATLTDCFRSAYQAKHYINFEYEMGRSLGMIQAAYDLGCISALEHSRLLAFRASIFQFAFAVGPFGVSA